MTRHRIRAHYEQLPEFERGCIIGLKEGQMGESLAIWVEAMRPLEEPGKGTLTAHRYVDDILRTVLLPFLLQYPGLIFQQECAKPHVTMNCLTDYQTLPWPARSPDPSPIEHVWDMMGRRLHVPGNVDDLVRQMEQIWQEIPQETIRVLYHFMSCHVAACIQARGGSTPY
ncbi:transposable element Tc1 transposase [Trichonephila clavipes]|nr:transposable element Tc1 transposase [Trichonephila clavipes]